MPWYLVMLEGGPIPLPSELQQAEKPNSQVGFFTTRKTAADTVANAAGLAIEDALAELRESFGKFIGEGCGESHLLCRPDTAGELVWSRATPGTGASHSIRGRNLSVCVDGPLDARASLRILTGGSIASMCPACRRGTMSAGPDGIRDPAPNSFAASKAGTLIGFSGSRFDRSSSQSALSSRHQRALTAMTSKCQPLSRASSRPMPYGPSRCSITPEAPWRLDRLKLGKIEFNNRPQGVGERTVLLVVRQRPASRHSGLQLHGRGDGVVPPLDPGAPVGEAACADKGAPAACAAR